MEEIKEFDGLKGKTIRSVSVRSDMVLMTFTDDTFAVISSDLVFDQDTIEIGRFHRHDWGDRPLLDAFGQEQVDEWKREDKQKLAKREAANKALRRQQYEQLKAEFEG